MTVRMDAVWIRTVSVLEMDLAEYMQLRKVYALQRDSEERNRLRQQIQGIRKSLNRRYSQFLAFTAGLPEADMDFDCDLLVPAIEIETGNSRGIAFGPSAVSSTFPYLANEFRDFIEKVKLGEVQPAISVPSISLEKWIPFKYEIASSSRVTTEKFLEPITGLYDAFVTFVEDRRPNPNHLRLTVINTAEDERDEDNGFDIDRSIRLNSLSSRGLIQSQDRLTDFGSTVEMVYIK